MWAELRFYVVKWGLWTNGQDIMAFVDTNRIRKDREGKSRMVYEITFSNVQELTDPSVYYAVAGLCFASLDEKFAGKNLVRLLASNRRPPF